MAHEDHCARQWNQGALDRVWITDLTYLRCAQGWVYLCAVRDVHSRRVLGYAMGEQHNRVIGHFVLLGLVPGVVGGLGRDDGGRWQAWPRQISHII